MIRLHTRSKGLFRMRKEKIDGWLIDGERIWIYCCGTQVEVDNSGDNLKALLPLLDELGG